MITLHQASLLMTIAGVVTVSIIEVLSTLPSSFVDALAGLVTVVVVGKLLRAESRLLLMSIAALLAYPHPAVFFAVAALGVVFRPVDWLSLPLER